MLARDEGRAVFAAARRVSQEVVQDEPPPHTDIPEHADGDPDFVPERYMLLTQLNAAAPGAGDPVALITPLDWPDEAPPPVDWLANGRIPRGDVTTLHGDGGAGKTDIACQLAEACARRAPYWLGHELASGPVVIL